MDRPDPGIRRRSVRFLRHQLLAVALGAAALLVGGCHHKVVRRGQLDEHAVRALGARISQIRGLVFLEPVQVRLSGDADLAAQARAQAERLRDSGRVERQGQLLAGLGLLQSGSELAGGTEAMLAEQPGGAYHPRVGRLDLFDRPWARSELIEALSFFVGRDLTFGEILAHELVHALQDQHFGLDPPPAAADNSDAELAHAALVEGDAFLAGFELGLGGLLSDPQEFVDFVRARAPSLGPRVPAYLQQRFAFPYLAGTEFVLALRQAEPGWAVIDQAHTRPPRSSEEVLHPDKYRAGDDPPRLPSLSGVDRAMAGEAPGFEPVCADSLGEFGIRALLSQSGQTSRAERQAAGWGGDRAGLYQTRPTGQQALVWISDWDSPADAVDFYDGLETLLATRHGPPDEAGLQQAFWAGPERQRRLELWGARVILFDAPAGADGYRAVLAASRADVAGPTLPAPALRPAEARSTEGLAVEQALVVDPRRPRYRHSQPGIRLGSDALGVSLGGLLQVRGLRGPAPPANGLGLQAARLRAEGHLQAGLELGLAFELALEPDQELLRDAYLSFSPVSEQLLYVGHFQMGRMKVPVSRARLLERGLQPLAERPQTALAWAPDRRVGFGYDLDLGRYRVPVRLRAGAFDGLAAGQGNGPLLAVRLDLTPSALTGWPVEIELGTAWFLDRNLRLEAGQPPSERLGVVLDGRLAWGPVWLEGELFWLDVPGGERFEGLGWSLTAGWFLLADFLEAVARYERLGGFDGFRGLADQPGEQATAGLTLHTLTDRFRMMYNAVWRRSAGLADPWQHWLIFQLWI